MKTILLTGLSGSGKSTIAERVKNNMPDVIWLDGDIIRQYMSTDLGYTLKDRFENLKRIAGLSKVLNDQGFDVILSLISPSENLRDMMRLIVGPNNFRVAWCNSPDSVCRERDTKGLYKKALQECLEGWTIGTGGASQIYDIPTIIDFEFDTTVSDNAIIDGYAKCLIEEFKK